MQGEALARGGGRREHRRGMSMYKNGIFGEGRGICEAQSGVSGGQRLTANTNVGLGCGT